MIIVLAVRFKEASVTSIIDYRNLIKEKDPGARKI